MDTTTTTTPHTSHPCARPDCVSSNRWILTDPAVDSPMGYDAIRANRTRWCVLVEGINRTFGATTFDTEAEAIAFRERMLVEADEAPEDPVGIDRLARSVPTPWGTMHRTR